MELYKLTITDSTDTMTFELLEIPIEIKDVEGAVDNTTIDGNVFTDYLYLKRSFEQKWAMMTHADYLQLRGFYERQWQNAEPATVEITRGADYVLEPIKARLTLADGGIVNACQIHQDVKLSVRETV